jgi:hypothetical protein
MVGSPPRAVEIPLPGDPSQPELGPGWRPPGTVRARSVVSRSSPSESGRSFGFVPRPVLRIVLGYPARARCCIVAHPFQYRTWSSPPGFSRKKIPIKFCPGPAVLSGRSGRGSRACSPSKRLHASAPRPSAVLGVGLIGARPFRATRLPTRRASRLLGCLNPSTVVAAGLRPRIHQSFAGEAARECRASKSKLLLHRGGVQGHLALSSWQGTKT